MKLEGLTVNFLGDSITEGCGIKNIQDSYWNLLKCRCGLKEARGYGIGGSRLAIQHVYQRPVDKQDFWTRAAEMDPDADLVVVFGGTNDFGSGDAPLGQMSDRTPYTFYGACHRLINVLIDRYPKGQLVFMTPLHRAPEERGGKRLKDYVDAIRQVTEYYGVPLVDLYAASQIQPQVESSRITYCPDGLHPNEAGHERIYSRLRGVLEAL